MSTCCWCTPGGLATVDFLQRYASRTQSGAFQTADEDLCYCLECVIEYHRAREELPFLHAALWELETLRLINHFEKSMRAELEDDDELYVVDSSGEAQLFDFSGQDFENKLRVPLLEILKYPYLLLHERVNELCVEALCRMEQANCSFQVFDKNPGVYLFLVHPNEMVRRWAILTAKSLGKVDRDDYYDLQEVLTCLFKVIELGLLENPDIYTSSVFEKGKLIILPSHMYDSTSYKNYWLGICMLLTILEEQAMDSLLLGSDKQNDFMQSILHTMERQSDDDSEDPFWPALHCFMVILDRLGSKVWGQLIDPVEAFQTIINNASYNREIQSIRGSAVKTKVEPESCLDDVVTCSQIVYSYNPDKTTKDSGWRSAICPDYCPNMYEEMETLASVLQSDIGQDMRVHNSTFLWFIPFVQSLMDLKDLGVAYIAAVIHHLHSQVKDVLSQTDQTAVVCDKVTEFFFLILVSVIELHRSKKCLCLLWVSSQQWVEAIVKCANLPTTAFARSSERSSSSGSRGTAATSLSLHQMPSNSVQLACVQLIRSLLKEGYQLGQQTLCKRFWDKFNLFLRGNLSLGCQLTSQETQELQTCLKQIIRKVPPCKVPPASYSKEESGKMGMRCEKDTQCLASSGPAFSKEPVKADLCRVHESSVLGKAGNAVEEDHEQGHADAWKLEGHPSSESCLEHSSENRVTKRAQVQGGAEICTRKHEPVRENPSCTPQNCSSGNGREKGCDGGAVMPAPLVTTDSLEKASAASEDFSLKDDVLGKTSKAKTEAQKSEICVKLSRVIKKQHRKSTLASNSVELKGNLAVPNTENFPSRKDTGGQKGDSFVHNLCLDPNDVLDNKNGGQKSPNSSLLKKKQLKKEEPDVSSFHENNGQIQECHVNNKHSVSSAELTNTFMHASSFKVPAALLESREKEKSKGTGRVSSDLREQAPSINLQSDTLIVSQVNRDFHRLSLLAQDSVTSFPSATTQKSSSQPRRRIKEKANQNKVKVACPGPVIIISDSEDADEQIPGSEDHIKRDKLCTEKECPEQCTSVANMSVERKLTRGGKTDSPVQFEDSGSQVFEFESQQNVFSVWQDQNPDKNPVQGDEESSALTADITNDWGYDTDYPMSEDVLSRGAEDTECAEAQSSSSAKELCKTQGKKCKRKLKNLSRPSPSVRKKDRSDLTERDLSGNKSRDKSSSSVEKATSGSSKRSSPKHHTYSKPVRKASVSKTPKSTNSDNKSLNYLSCRTTPAIVPPKKFRQRPEPTSIVEKLHLKRAERRAFELSQRSRDSVDRLREYGRAVGVVETRKKAKLISFQAIPGNNKKLRVSQDREFLRQGRPKSRQNRRGLPGPGGTDTARAGPQAAQWSDGFMLQSARSRCSGEGGAEAIKGVSSVQEPVKAKCVSQVAGEAGPSKQRPSPVLNGRLPTHKAAGSANEDPLGRSDLTRRPLEVAPLKRGEPDSDSDMEGDNIFLTQYDPEDMDLCSQMQPDNGKLIEVVHGQEGVQGEGSTGRSLPGSLSSACQQKGCAETVTDQGSYCWKHSGAKPADEGVFRKPSLPLSAPKPLRPSTRKIFCSSSTSRSAYLSKSMETTSAPPALKSKSSGGQPVVKAPQPVSPKPLGQMKSLCNVHPPAPDNSSRQAHRLPFAKSRPFCSPVSTLSSQSISDTFVREVLKWKYEMFMNFDRCGPPASLCHTVSRPVPVRFQDCGDYFKVFFPLMVLNTFETVAQEWISSPNKEKFCELQLRKFPSEYKKYWEFVVSLEECELSKQLHPKENDLVFLVPERPKGQKRKVEGSPVQRPQEHHCAYVHKFRRTSVMHHGKYECSLAIQMLGDLPACESVRCFVVSSLVTTQRKLKAMSLLSGRNQLARAILNPNPMDFCTNDLLTTTSDRITAYLRDFNEDQKKAIETAYAMVKQSPAVAKICLIHGPPGTGKSKTIVGLLYRLLTERRGHADENSNAKIKQNRVLVCAPSNAAVDELMKKIILEFKERCRDKKNPLGNCGDINLVRLGPEKSINNEVLKFSLDNQVDHRMKKDLPSYVQEMHKRKEYLDSQLDKLSRQRALCRGGRGVQRQELDEKIAQVSKERQELASKIKEVQGRPQKTQSIIILESHIVCCTLSTSGGLLLESAFRGQGGVPFSCVIVDEAGQASEVETLTPLLHRCNKLVLVGDPQQLPPTVISMKAQEYGYDQSMMARFCKLLEENVEHHVSGRLPVLRLTMQYRMHPDICLFPSTYIYSRGLKTNRVTETIRCSSDWPFQPYLVFDVGDGSERRENDSYVNVQEIKVVIELIKLLKEKRKDISSRNIGIITHYKAQKTMIQKELDREFEGKGPAEVDTVDAFQGRQKDCVIVTCVRANAAQGSIGFLASLQRLNVTITRAKYSLFILGHLRTLMDNLHWNHLIQDAQRRGAIIKTCDKNYKHDALKILKLKPALQRSLTHPLTAGSEGPGPQGGSPGHRPDCELLRASLASSLNHSPSGSKEAAVPVAAKDPERPPIRDQLRDPRLLRRASANPDATGSCPRDPEPVGAQHPGAAPPAAVSSLPASAQAPGSAVEQTRATGSSHRPHVPWEPPAASTDATDRSPCNQEGERCHQGETRAFGARDQETQTPASHYSKRNSDCDDRRPEDSSSKKRKL